MDKLYLQRHQKRLEKLEAKALEEIANFLSLGEAYCSVSWGKDSTVLAYLSNQVQAQLVYVNSNRANPDSLLVRDAFIDQFNPLYSEVFNQLSPLDQGETINGFFDKVQSQYGDRRILGVRAQESANRKISAKVHGVATTKVCRPMIDWRIEDIFAFLQWRNLPIHSVYAMGGCGEYDRNQLRVDVLGDVRGTGQGRLQWEWLYYPEETSKHQQEIKYANRHA